MMVGGMAVELAVPMAKTLAVLWADLRVHSMVVLWVESLVSQTDVQWVALRVG